MALKYLSVKVIQRDYLPMFSQRTIRKIVKEHMKHSFIHNRLLVLQSEVERYVASLNEIEPQ